MGSPAPDRPSWDEYFLAIARAAASRSTCPRLAVGAVIVRDRDIIATGYNGAPAGMPECLLVGCELERGRCQRAVHAELNAILRAARTGVSTKGATMYVTHSPCRECAKAVVNAGIARLVYGECYGPGTQLLREAGVSLEELHGR